MTKHVIIAGVGTASLVTALGLGLGQAGIKVTVLAASIEVAFSPRALVYHFPVIPHLEKRGILEDCACIGFHKQDYGWRIARTGEVINWSFKVLNDKVDKSYDLHLGQDKLALIALDHIQNNRLSKCSWARGGRCPRRRLGQGDHRQWGPIQRRLYYGCGWRSLSGAPGPRFAEGR